MSRASRATSRLAVRYFDDRVLLTDSPAWAYFRLPTVSYEFITPEEREALATNITIALAAIRMPDAEVHLRIAHRTYPAAEWATALDATSDEGPAGATTSRRCTGTSGPRTSGPRRSTSAYGWASAACARSFAAGCSRSCSASTSAARRPSASTTTRVDDREIARWTDQAERLGRALASSALYARHATSAEIAWLFQHAATGPWATRRPSAARRRRWGRGEIESLVEGQIHNGRSLLRIEQPAGDSYVALPVVRPVPRPHAVPRRRAVAALRRPAAVPRGGQLADEADPARQGQQGRGAQARPRPRHGHAHQGGGRGGAARAGRADRRRPHAGARHHQGAAAVRVRLAPADRVRPDRGAAACSGSRRSSSTTATSASTSSTPPATSSRCSASRCRGEAAGQRLRAAAAAAHDRGRHGHRHRRARRPGRRERRRLDRPVHRGDVWAGHGPSCTSTRWWRPRATGRPLSPSPGSRAAARPRWRCC